MEGFSEKTPEVEIGYDREAIVTASALEAKRLIEESINSSLSMSEWKEAVISLMNKLAEDNTNRHVVEAMAQIITIKEAKSRLQLLNERYPAVNDDRYAVEA
jgi:hypothetical protein